MSVNYAAQPYYVQFVECLSVYMCARSSEPDMQSVFASLVLLLLETV
jgi:hypothetical protein